MTVNGKGFIANNYPAKKVIAVIRTFVDRLNLHSLLYCQVTEGGTNQAMVFHQILRLAEILARKMLAFQNSLPGDLAHFQ